MSDQGAFDDDGRFEREFPVLAAFMHERGELSGEDPEPARPLSWGQRVLVALVAGVAVAGLVYGAGWLLVRLDPGTGIDDGPYPRRGAVEAVTDAVDRALVGGETVDVSAVRGAVGRVRGAVGREPGRSVSAVSATSTPAASLTDGRSG